MDRIPTPKLRLILEETKHPHADDAIDELEKLHEANHHLVTYFFSVKQQTDSSGSALARLFQESHDRVRLGCVTLLHDMEWIVRMTM